MDHVLKAISGISRVAAIVSAVILVVMVVHFIVEIALRTFFDASTFALDEFVGYEVAAMSFLALGFALEKGGLIRVGFLLEMLKRRPGARKTVEVVCCVVTLVTFTIPIAYFWRSVRLAYERGYTSGTYSDIPQWIPEAVMLVGLVLFWVQLVAHTIRVLRDEIDLAQSDG